MKKLFGGVFLFGVYAKREPFDGFDPLNRQVRFRASTQASGLSLLVASFLACYLLLASAWGSAFCRQLLSCLRLGTPHRLFPGHWPLVNLVYTEVHCVVVATRLTRCYQMQGPPCHRCNQRGGRTDFIATGKPLKVPFGHHFWQPNANGPHKKCL